MRLVALASLALVPLLFVARAAIAEEDAFGVGTGADGALSITSPTIVNDYVQLVADASGTLLTTGPTDGKFAVGDLVMIHRTTGRTPVPTTLPEIQAQLTFSGTALAAYEFARIAGVSASSITLTKPLVSGVSAFVTQIIRVPEYTTVDVSGVGVIQASPWDGAKGGVVVFFANDVVHVGGLGIDATGAGFRGGLSVAGQASSADSVALDADPSAGVMNGQKGEGVGLLTFGPTFVGRGNRFGGGGGGNSHKAGGGGGSNGGKGGVGGNATTGAQVGGLGGSALEYTVPIQLLFGGGGGAGHATTSAPTSGAPGGGAILIRGKTLQLDSAIRANGATPASSGAAGGGGGGAGGSVALRFSGAMTCTGAVIQARGGVGGKVATIEGPGGGGSGGRISLQGATIAASCTADVDGNQPGTNLVGLANGAAPGHTGASVKLVAAFCGVDADCPMGELCDFSTDACSASTDLDGDGVANATDNCVHVANVSQDDEDMDGVGDACEPVIPPADADGDGVPDATDNCVDAPNPDQADVDADGVGDACELPSGACAADDACGDASSGMICVSGQCAMGCRGASGNGCAPGKTCSSSDEHPGTCSDAEPTSSGSDGDVDFVSVGGDGVACATTPLIDAWGAPAGAASLLAVAGLAARRRRRLATEGSRPTLPPL